VVLDLLAGAAAGLAIGLSLAAPPGPVNALIASRAVTRSWRSGFLVGCGAMTADAGFLVLSVLAFSLLSAVRSLFPFIALLGAAVMAYFAWRVTRSWNRIPAADSAEPNAHAASYATGLAVNATSPYPILWWLTGGLALIDRLGPAVLVGFFAGILLWISAFPWTLRTAQRRFARTYHAVLAFSVISLAAFAIWLVWSAFDALT